MKTTLYFVAIDFGNCEKLATRTLDIISPTTGNSHNYRTSSQQIPVKENAQLTFRRSTHLIPMNHLKIPQVVDFQLEIWQTS